MKYRIKEILKSKNMTLLKLSEIIGVKSANLSVALSENGNPTVETLEKIATALEVSISDLFEQPNNDTINCPHCGGKIKISKD